jgi:hypothetical protein
MNDEREVLKIMNEKEWEQLTERFPQNFYSTSEANLDWPFGQWHWKARRDWGCDYIALVHEEGNMSDIRSMMVAFIALEDDGTYSVIEPDVPITSDLGLPARGSRYCLGLDATGFASPKGAKKYVETLLQLTGELNHRWNARLY